MPVKPVKLWGSLVGPSPSLYEYIHRGSKQPSLVEIVDDVIQGGFAFYFGDATGSLVAIDSGPNGYHGDYSREKLTEQGLTQLGRAPFNEQFTASANNSYVPFTGAGLKMEVPYSDGIPIAELPPRGPGTLVIALSTEGNDSWSFLLRSTGGVGLQVDRYNESWYIANGAQSYSITNRYAQKNTHVAELLVVTVVGDGTYKIYLNGELVTTQTGWSTAAVTGTYSQIEVMRDNVDKTQTQAVVWMADVVNDDAWVLGLWNGYLQKKVNTTSLFTAEMSTDIPKLEYAADVLFYHEFTGDILNPAWTVPYTPVGMTASSVRYSYNASNTLWTGNSLQYPGSNGAIMPSGQVAGNNERGPAGSNTTATYIGSVGSTRRYQITYPGHNVITGDDSIYITGSVTDSLGGDWTSTFSNLAHGATAIDASNFFIEMFAGPTLDLTISNWAMQNRFSDDHAIYFDTGLTNYVIDIIYDSSPGASATAHAAGCVIFRMVDDNNYWYYYNTPGRVELYRVNAGVHTQVAFGNTSANTNCNTRQVRVSVKGDRFYCFDWDYNYKTTGVNPVDSGGAASGTMSGVHSTGTKVGFFARSENSNWPRIRTFAVLKPLGM